MNALSNVGVDSKIMYRLPAEVWILIAAYFPSLREFMRLWVSCQRLQQQLNKHDSIFWKSLLTTFIQERNIAMDSISVSITGSSKFLSKSRIVERNTLEDFKVIENLFTRRKCSRSGCFQYYEEWMNHASACWHHPGQMKSGMFLSCCRANSFQAPGCKSTFHSGMFHYMLNSFRAIDLAAKEEQAHSSATSGKVNGGTVAASSSFLPEISSSPSSSNSSRATANTTASLPHRSPTTTASASSSSSRSFLPPI